LSPENSLQISLICTLNNSQWRSERMKLRGLLESLNPWRLLAYASVLLFCLLFCLRLDSSIQCSWWLVFSPLLLWKLGVIIGCVMGCVRYRQIGPSRWDQLIQFRAMLLSSLLLGLLLAFEILACLRLEHELLRWTLAVIPLLALAVVGIGGVIWSLRHDRTCDLELFCASNLLQFIFLALQLDGLITWSWGFVLIPLWIALCVAIILVVYSVILAVLLLRSSQAATAARGLARQSLHVALGYSAAAIPMLAFCVLITEKLDQRMHINYLTAGCPLLLSLVAMCCLACYSRKCNIWWFGIGKEFAQFLLEACPLLQEYANVSYKTVPQAQRQSQLDQQGQQQSPSQSQSVSPQPSTSQRPDDGPSSASTASAIVVANSPTTGLASGSDEHRLTDCFDQKFLFLNQQQKLEQLQYCCGCESNGNYLTHNETLCIRVPD
ncbi:hypothetical protein BOX15_Mlig028622g1, partial [Macrostomum lignano]